ncbi:hypothetical protein [Dolichospermum sp. UHCC 0259]|jgi:hypothetical protein|uniref:hypothetical protein n=1 Tax=Dolichospermum sp. UHCC 0259 TaxID=2590010 RepID=UPI0014455184|nr:hypothetical protein [Dolichospermum sp. UHCC 0259]MTJ48923.1 hypothetical protein [Dolichospermum sp. UHCC 0259]
MVQTQHLNTTFFSLPQNTTTNPTRGQISHINFSCSKETTGCSVKTRNDLQTTTCIEKVDTTNGAEKQDLRLHGKANFTGWLAVQNSTPKLLINKSHTLIEGAA